MRSYLLATVMVAMAGCGGSSLADPNSAPKDLSTLPPNPMAGNMERPKNVKIRSGRTLPPPPPMRGPRN